jgi:hypothetical protein
MEESRCDDAGNGGNALHSVGGYFSGRIESGLLLAGTRGNWLRPVDMTRSRTCVPVGSTCRAREIAIPKAVVWLRFGVVGWFGSGLPGLATRRLRLERDCSVDSFGMRRG